MKKGQDIIDDLKKNFNTLLYELYQNSSARTSDFFSRLTLSDLVQIKKGLAGINSLVTMMTTVAFIDILNQYHLINDNEHDEMIAFLSQLTHCIAISLMACKDSTHLAEYTGDSFRDLTRIANINKDMWTELFLLNKEHLIKEMNNFIAKFIEFKDMIESENIQKIKEMMQISKDRRIHFNKEIGD